MKSISHPRYILFLGVFALSSIVLASLTHRALAVVGGFDVGVLAFVLSCVPLWRKGDADTIRRQARRDDAGQVMLLCLTGIISLVILAALSALYLDGGKMGAVDIAVLIATLLASWTFTNLILAFHYARMYYSADDGKDQEGLNFPGDCVPDFSDFVNFAFVIGMTCQTADIAIATTPMRRVSTFHGLFAFFFNLGILALTVNVLASTAGK
ncbi:DUF1345 domain-containing protein [Novosphingobium sp. Leaf2]|uniref:DUF1345 domain-containing protein n=1 Tax=Novosphingobium sp. Leaf2 TaxID=1735670 RepID=UPI000B299FA4|nr:DUF1345 domain-containing protein [Novosphingobium sp. Leaf2]